jgi:hypothetical protein
MARDSASKLLNQIGAKGMPSYEKLLMQKLNTWIDDDAAWQAANPRDRKAVATFLGYTPETLEGYIQDPDRQAQAKTRKTLEREIGSGVIEFSEKAVAARNDAREISRIQLMTPSTAESVGFSAEQADLFLPNPSRMITERERYLTGEGRQALFATPDVETTSRRDLLGKMVQVGWVTKGAVADEPMLRGKFLRGGLGFETLDQAGDQFTRNLGFLREKMKQEGGYTQQQIDQQATQIQNTYDLGKRAIAIQGGQLEINQYDATSTALLRLHQGNALDVGGVNEGMKAQAAMTHAGVAGAAAILAAMSPDMQTTDTIQGLAATALGVTLYQGGLTGGYVPEITHFKGHLGGTVFNPSNANREPFSSGKRWLLNWAAPSGWTGTQTEALASITEEKVQEMQRRLLTPGGEFDDAYGAMSQDKNLRDKFLEGIMSTQGSTAPGRELIAKVRAGDTGLALRTLLLTQLILDFGKTKKETK